ncbi:helix-turn-helix domain-containing protein [Parasphingorhabdus sp.]|uniref:helix-turn-helix domain-containing protein n=1 Tax=Parasphingorhabdus sp. TaxID=2709688 RepID=UPI003A950575
MSMPAVDRLNDGQRDCLRLVLAHFNSKEIARELDVSPHTVDQRLRMAMRILNAQSRFDAAKKFAAFDQENAYQSLIYQPSDVALQTKIANLRSSTGSIAAGTIAGGVGSDCADLVDHNSNGNAGVPNGAFEKPEVRHRRFPIPQYRGEKNSLGAVERLGWILAIAIGSALSFGGLIAGLEALSRLNG